VDQVQTRERYRIGLPHGRSAKLSGEQVLRIARGLGDGHERAEGAGRSSRIVEALESLPSEQRADALSVALRRFGDKQDLESIARSCGLTSWRVWQLEEAFRQALEQTAQPGPAEWGSLGDQLHGSVAASLMSEDLLANAIAHGERVDLDAEHEASLR
jgi:hypothetical protein